MPENFEKDNASKPETLPPENMWIGSSMPAAIWANILDNLSIAESHKLATVNKQLRQKIEKAASIRQPNYWSTSAFARRFFLKPNEITITGYLQTIYPYDAKYQYVYLNFLKLTSELQTTHTLLSQCFQHNYEDTEIIGLTPTHQLNHSQLTHLEKLFIKVKKIELELHESIFSSLLKIYPLTSRDFEALKISATQIPYTALIRCIKDYFKYKIYRDNANLNDLDIELLNMVATIPTTLSAPATYFEQINIKENVSLFTAAILAIEANKLPRETLSLAKVQEFGTLNNLTAEFISKRKITFQPLPWEKQEKMYAKVINAKVKVIFSITITPINDALTAQGTLGLIRKLDELEAELGSLPSYKGQFSHAIQDSCQRIIMTKREQLITHLRQRTKQIKKISFLENFIGPSLAMIILGFIGMVIGLCLIGTGLMPVILTLGLSCLAFVAGICAIVKILKLDTSGRGEIDGLFNAENFLNNEKNHTFTDIKPSQVPINEEAPAGTIAPDSTVYIKTPVTNGVQALAPDSPDFKVEASNQNDSSVSQATTESDPTTQLQK